MIQQVLKLFQRKPDGVASGPEVAAVPAVKERQPDGWAYRYPDGIRFETSGQRINGNEPLEAIPYFFGTPEIKLEKETVVAPAEPDLSALLSPGRKTQRTAVEIPLPEVRPPEVNALATVAPHISEVAPVSSTQEPTATLEPVIDEDLRPVDWNEESRDDLPPRSPRRIRFLIPQESELQRIARIRNDKIRWHKKHNLPIW